MSLERDLMMRCIELAVRLNAPSTNLDALLVTANALYQALPDPPSKTQQAVQRALSRESVPGKKSG